MAREFAIHASFPVTSARVEFARVASGSYPGKISFAHFRERNLFFTIKSVSHTIEKGIFFFFFVTTRRNRSFSSIPFSVVSSRLVKGIS